MHPISIRSLNSNRLNYPHTYFRIWRFKLMTLTYLCLSVHCILTMTSSKDNRGAKEVGISGVVMTWTENFSIVFWCIYFVFVFGNYFQFRVRKYFRFRVYVRFLMSSQSLLLKLAFLQLVCVCGLSSRSQNDVWFSKHFRYGTAVWQKRFSFDCLLSMRTHVAMAYIVISAGSGYKCMIIGLSIDIGGGCIGA